MVLLDALEKVLRNERLEAFEFRSAADTCKEVFKRNIILVNYPACNDHVAAAELLSRHPGADTLILRQKVAGRADLYASLTGTALTCEHAALPAFASVVSHKTLRFKHPRGHWELYDALLACFAESFHAIEAELDFGQG